MNDRENDLPGDELPPETEGPFEGRDSADARLERIADYIRESLAKTDGLAANLGATNGELMQLAVRLKERSADMLARDPDDEAPSDRWYPVFDLLLRLHRQIANYSQLAVKLRGLNDN
jgi:hypothetical protein